MAVVMPTDWKARADDLGNRLLVQVDGEKKWDVIAGFDAPVKVNMAQALATGETLTNPVLKLWQCYAQGETGDVDKTATSIPDPPDISGAPELSQRVKNLEAGRVYQLEILHGAAGNRRGNGLIIRCIGGHA